jgi:cell volume regulation protein A
VSSTLEIESGSNDPMAVFLTVAILELLLAGKAAPGLETLNLFLVQMGGGALAGLAGGRVLAWLANRLPLERGMYPMLVLSGGLTLYGLTTYLGASGFLAIYLAGVVMGNLALRESRQVLHVHNGLAWLAQIAMFLMLGLLATPRELVEHALPALLLALALMFLARPLAVFLCLVPFRFPWREQVFIAWVGLRGAVPIILALFPLLAGLPVAALILDVAFFVVLVSLTVQGWSIAPLARWLRLEVPTAGRPVDRLELATPDREQPAILGFRVLRHGPVAGHRADILDLPGKARLVTVLRRHRNLSPEEAGPLQAGDMVYVLADEDEAERLGEHFSPVQAPRHLDRRVFFGDLTLLGSAPVADVARQYGLALPDLSERLSLAQFLASRLRARPAVGDRIRLDNLEFVVREITDGHIARVGIKFHPDPTPASDKAPPS